MGVSRSASTVIAYAMKEFGWPLEKAYNYVKQKRSITRPNAGFMRQLSEYEGILDARWVPASAQGWQAERGSPGTKPARPRSASQSAPTGPGSGFRSFRSSVRLWVGAGLRGAAIVWALMSGFPEGSAVILLACTQSLFCCWSEWCLASHPGPGLLCAVGMCLSCFLSTCFVPRPVSSLAARQAQDSSGDRPGSTTGRPGDQGIWSPPEPQHPPPSEELIPPECHRCKLWETVWQSPRKQTAEELKAHSEIPTP